jgi:hypothetical protein
VLRPGKEFRDGCRWRSNCPRPSRAPISRAVGGSAHSRRRGCAEPSRVVRWSSPQPAEPIMATMWLDRYSASATVHNNLPLKPSRTAPPLGSHRSGTAGRRGAAAQARRQRTNERTGRDISTFKTRAVHRLFESEGFRFLGKYDSRCWLGWRPASDGPTSFQ